MFQFVATPDFKEDLLGLDRTIQGSVKDKLAFIAQLEHPLQYSKKLRGHKDILRFRAGDYRMVFRLSSDRIILLNVGHRRDVYNGY